MHPRFDERLKDLQQERRALSETVDKGGRPPHDGGMEARVSKLEAITEYIQRDIGELKDDVRSIRSDINGIRTTDFRILFGATIAVALGLAALMAKGFGWI